MLRSSDRDSWRRALRGAEALPLHAAKDKSLEPIYGGLEAQPPAWLATAHATGSSAGG
jgi:hypothetical protein